MLVLFIVLWTIAGVLIIADPKNRSTRWGSAIAFFSGLGGLGALLREFSGTLTDVTLKNYIVLVASLILSLSHHLPPYALMVYSVIYSGLFHKYKVFLKYCTYILLIPVLIMNFIFPIVPMYEPSFLILSLWVVPYILAANFLLVYSYHKEKNKKVKLQRLIVCILLTPPTLFTIFANYILRIFAINNLWQYNLLTIIAAFILFAFFGLRFGIMGVRLKIERYRVDSTIKAITSGTTMLNHTIKNEILKIGMCTNNVKNSVNKPDQDMKDINENLDYVLESTEFMTKMMKRIQEHVQDIVLEEKTNNFKVILSKSLDMVSPYLKEKEINVINSCTNDFLIKCDNIHVQEVLQNLFKNSIEAMELKGEITIDLFDNKKSFTVSIKDTGSGITKENLQFIFDPFFSTKRTSTNFGLGLSYCFNIMQQHGGTLEISSEKEVGTTVILIFPKKKVVSLAESLFKRGFIYG